MENTIKTGYITLLLALIAGYCDTVTFVAAHAIFSAHVTGNFIVFAYQLVKGSEWQAWIKLLTFPVFILSVIVGGRIGAAPANRYRLLLFEGLILLLAAVIAMLGTQHSNNWLVYVVAMVVVCAMGLQNAFGKLYAKEIHGPTTMMTGNVTQASLDLGTLFKTGFNHPEAALSLKKQLYTILGFLAGCFLGAVAGKLWGLPVIILPGLLLIYCYLNRSGGRA